MTGFKKEDELKSHQDDCLHFESMPIYMPQPKSSKEILSFKLSHQCKQQIKPFACELDLESILIDDKCDKTDRLIQKHVPVSFFIKCFHTQSKHIFYEKLYLGSKDCIDQLFSALDQIRGKILPFIRNNMKMEKLSPRQEREFQDASICHICKKELGDDRVKDHDHATGLYRGPAHDKCNLNYSFRNYEIPVVVHNFKGYDSHLIMKAYGRYQDEKHLHDKPRCIAANKEKYMSVSFMNFVFVDSLQFLNASLSDLAKTMWNSWKSDPASFEGNFFHFMCKEFGLENIDLMCKILPYSYRFAKSDADFYKTVFPTQKDYDNDLEEKECTDEEYQRVLEVRKRFSFKTYKDEHDTYLKLDVCLLADIFENFRRTCFKSYGLDPIWYVSLPSYSWDTMLKNISDKNLQP